MCMEDVEKQKGHLSEEAWEPAASSKQHFGVKGREEGYVSKFPNLPLL